MKRKFLVGAASVLAAAGLVFGTAAPATATTWYQGGFNTYKDCGWAAYGKQLQGYAIVQGCHYRPYDGKWAFSYQAKRGRR